MSTQHSDASPAPDLEFVYVGDPMCSWCWGFSPVLDALQENFEIPLRAVVGGLRPGDGAEAVDDRLAGFLAHHWHQVEEASGQPFDHAILERRGWRYDTELPCIAVVTLREQAPEQTLPFFARLHRAFYAEGVDITVPEAYPELVSGFAVDIDRFVEELASAEMKKRAWQDFAFARRHGIHGFPSLLLRDGDSFGLVTQGYAPMTTLEPALRGWLDRRFGEAGAGLYCDIAEGAC